MAVFRGNDDEAGLVYKSKSENICQMCTCFMVALLTFLLSALTVLAVIVFIRMKSPKAIERVELRKPSYAMQYMEQAVSFEVDPCNDFYIYACNGLAESNMKSRTELIEQKYDDFLHNFRMRLQTSHISIQYFQEEFSKCEARDACEKQMADNFANVLGLALMDEFNLWSLSKSILNGTMKAFIDLIEQNDNITVNGKSRAVQVLKMCDVQLGLPKDYASWDVLDEMYKYGFANTTPSSVEYKKIGDWYNQIYGRKPYRSVGDIFLSEHNFTFGFSFRFFSVGLTLTFHFGWILLSSTDTISL